VQPRQPIPDGARHDQAERMIVNRRRAIAARMRRSGFTYQQIADFAEYPDGTRCYPDGTQRAAVYVDIKRGLAEATTELHLEAAELRELIAERLDDMYLRLQPAIEYGDVKAIDAGRRIQADLAKLYGVNEPERHEVITVDAIDAAARELEAEINRRAALDARPADTPALPARTESGTGPG
jgi:hypothetical protein